MLIKFSYTLKPRWHSASQSSQ